MCNILSKLFREAIAVPSTYKTKHINTHCGKNAVLLGGKTSEWYTQASEHYFKVSRDFFGLVPLRQLRSLSETRRMAKLRALTH
jgi:hypothetical protein